jgi:hypothetical protein
MEAPDSPPDVIFSPSSTPQAQSTQQAANPARANGDSSAKINFGAPGSSWQTKKFIDEYERAENQLLDRQWDHSECGYLGSDRILLIAKSEVRRSSYSGPVIVGYQYETATREYER